MNDLQPVSIHHRNLRPTSPRRNHAPMFHRNSVATQPQRLDQSVQRHWRGQPLDATRLPIYLNL